MKNYKAFMGIDVSKNTLDTTVMVNDGQSYYQQFTNDLKGFEQLLTWSNKLSGCKQEELFACMEHTGIYVLQLSCYLSEQNIIHCVENPLQIKRSMGITRIKNDKADSKMIARYALLHHKELRVFNIPSKNIVTLKALLSHRDRLVKSRHALNTSSTELAKYSEKEVHGLILKDSKSLVKSLDAKIKSVDIAIEELIKSDKELNKNYQLALSVGGVGKSIAAHMIVCTRNFTSFKNWRQFACYSGIAPFEHTSGTSIKAPARISQMGNKRIKGLLSTGACSAILHDQELKNYYNKRVAEGKAKLSVLNIIKNKIVSRVFAVVNRGTPYVNIANYN